MRAHVYLRSAQEVLAQYDGAMPLAAWLKVYFKAHKKFGSRDRKTVAHFCYCYYRLGAAFKDRAVEERIVIALFLCSAQPNALLDELNPDWNAAAGASIEEKIKRVAADVLVTNIFPWNNYLSKEIDVHHFNASLLIQPLLYLRIRPGKKDRVVEALRNHNIPFELQGENSIAIENSTRADAVLQIDRDVVVQDRSSQQVLDLINENKKVAPLEVWDCCAASGGKSILLVDTFKNVQLTVSDVRQSILNNLRQRFATAGINNYNWFVGNAATLPQTQHKKFDLIICDAPCSGSGTWSRTPEQLHFFTTDKMEHYASLQKSIAGNVYKALKPGGMLLYITCSVFTAENEEVVAYLQNKRPLQLVGMRYYKGYTQKADTLFAALFTAL